MSSTPYDSILYDATAHTHTHPTRLATMGYLLGLEPPSLYGARVLELGCATGTNLLAMAEAYPDATFVGVDYAAKQIEMGRARLAESGLKNLVLDHRSVGDFTEADGIFDYVIAHGVYSWIPKDMQDALLRIYSRNMAPNGVGYISYNTLPGWSLAGLVRDVMLYHTRNLPQGEKVPHAKAILEFLSKYSPADTPYGQMLRETAERLSKFHDYYLAHEYLEADNEPIHFHVFVERIHAHGLEYLSEVELGSMLPNFLPPDVANILGQLSKDFIDYEQYLDFLRARTFRQSLVVHDSQTIDRQVKVDRVAPLSVYATFSIEGTLEDIRPDSQSIKFTTLSGQNVESHDPTFKSVIHFIAAASPRTLTVAEVVAGVPRVDLRLTDAQWRESVLMRLFEGFSGGILRLVKDPSVTEHHTIDEKPKASVAARVEAGFGKVVTLKGHQGSTLDFVHLKVLTLLDGTRTRSDLADAIFESHGRGEFKFTDGTSGLAESLVKSKITALIDKVLVDVRTAGLLRH